MSLQNIDPSVKTEMQNQLLRLYSDEWLAVYQYNVEDAFCQMLQNAGRLSPVVYSSISSELQQHMQEELNHSQLLIPLLLKFGTAPISDIDFLSKNANAQFLKPNTNDIITLNQALESENGAIVAYSNALQFAKTYLPKEQILIDILSNILEQEYEHKSDLEKLLIDLQDTRTLPKSPLYK